MYQLNKAILEFIRSGEGKETILAMASELNPYRANQVLWGNAQDLILLLGQAAYADGVHLPELTRPSPEGYRDRAYEIQEWAEDFVRPLKDEKGTICLPDSAILKLPVLRPIGYGSYDDLTKGWVRCVGYVEFEYEASFKGEIEAHLDANKGEPMTANRVGGLLALPEPKESFVARGGGRDPLLRDRHWSMGGDPWNGLAGLNTSLPAVLKKAVFRVGQFHPIRN